MQIVQFSDGSYGVRRHRWWRCEGMRFLALDTCCHWLDRGAIMFQMRCTGSLLEAEYAMRHEHEIPAGVDYGRPFTGVVCDDGDDHD